MATSLQDLFVEELRDIYDGEKRILRALPKMAKAVQSLQLKAAFTTHARETERQITRLEQVFRALGLQARGKKCDGIQGLIDEANTHIEELDGALLDAALLSGAQKVEHYEIAAYGTLAYFAEILGQDRAKSLLGATLDEEKATDEKLNQLAKSNVNRKALAGIGVEAEDEGFAGMMSGMLGFGRRSASRSSRAASGRRRSSRGARATGRRTARSASKRAAAGRTRRRASTRRARKAATK